MSTFHSVIIGIKPAPLDEVLDEDSFHNRKAKEELDLLYAAHDMQAALAAFVQDGYTLKTYADAVAALVKSKGQ
jgi:hypothetical protein